MDTLAQKALNILDSNLYINLATSSLDGQPWNTPVYAVRDEDFNFYWRSWCGAEHSKNIQDNEKVFLTCYDSTRDLSLIHI